MDYLRQGIHLRGYAQQNPKQEYKREAFEMFWRRCWIVVKMRRYVTFLAMSARIRSPKMKCARQQMARRRMRAEHLQYRHDVQASERRWPRTHLGAGPGADVVRRFRQRAS